MKKILLIALVSLSGEYNYSGYMALFSGNILGRFHAVCARMFMGPSLSDTMQSAIKANVGDVSVRSKMDSAVLLNGVTSLVQATPHINALVAQMALTDLQAYESPLSAVAAFQAPQASLAMMENPKATAMASMVPESKNSDQRSSDQKSFADDGGSEGNSYGLLVPFGLCAMCMYMSSGKKKDQVIEKPQCSCTCQSNNRSTLKEVGAGMFGAAAFSAIKTGFSHKKKIMTLVLLYKMNPQLARQAAYGAARGGYIAAKGLQRAWGWFK